MTPTPVEDRKRLIMGSCYVALGQLFFGTNDAIVKYVNISESQIIGTRYIIQLMLGFTWWKIKKPLVTNNCEHLNYHTHWYGDIPYTLNIWCRGLTYFSTILFLWYGLHKMPIGDTTCIMYTSPLLVVFIAHIFLGEELPNKFILIPCLIFTIIGLILISRPHFALNIIYKITDNSDDITSLNMTGVICILIAMVSWSISNILIRTAIPAHFLQIEMVSSFQAVFIWLPLIMILNQFIFYDQYIGNIYWKYDIQSIIITIFIGIFGFASLALTVIGYQYGSATKVAWLEYLLIIISFIYQIFLFNETPNKYEIFGCISLIIGCALPIIYDVCIYCCKQKQDIFSRHYDSDELAGLVDL